MDLDCGGYFNQHLPEAVDRGEIPLASIRRAARRLLLVQMRLGMFDQDSKQPFRKLGLDDIDTSAHRAIAESAAIQGIVLLQNSNQTLPLPRVKTGGWLKSLAVIGPNANATTTLQSNYAGAAPYLISPLEGIAAHMPPGTVAFAPGCMSVASLNRSGFPAAVAAATSADATVLVVGLDGSQEGEAHDRVSLRLPGLQSDLLTTVVQAIAGRPLILVVISGGPVDLAAAKANDGVHAIVSAGYPGQSGGVALASVLFGLYSPHGRLTTTWYLGRAIILFGVEFYFAALSESHTFWVRCCVRLYSGYLWYYVGQVHRGLYASMPAHGF